MVATRSEFTPKLVILLILLILLILCGAIFPINVEATICGSPPSLDTSYENATTVMVIRLVSSTVSDNFIASNKFESGFLLKGQPLEDLSFDINISSISGCGPDLVMGKSYVIFLVEKHPILRIVDNPDTARWIEKRLQTRGSK